MNRGTRALILAVIFAVGVCATALPISNNLNVGIVILGTGKVAKSTDLEMVAGEKARANSGVCWIITREGKAKNGAKARGTVTISHGTGRTQTLGPLTSTVAYRAAPFDDSIGCGCVNSELAIEVGDVVHGSFDLKKLGKLKANQSANLQLWVFDGVTIPGTLTDCSSFF